MKLSEDLRTTLQFLQQQDAVAGGHAHAGGVGLQHRAGRGGRGLVQRLRTPDAQCLATPRRAGHREGIERAHLPRQPRGRLREEGVDIARRTVAKYRDALRIPSSVQRKREKAASA